ncbi:MAG TPA: GNAT family N-acetyltransferase [Clostridia bacterium]|jgi:ribosomal protein S18 acetylase RimI-like enzyme|nr:GNAT family N-acetyltransferase [Clostridia bacterium]HRX43007.1 GNAT family N-acetyltransferase [Clostridia bacterium]
MEILLRKAGEEDLAEILAIQKKAFLVQAQKYDAYDIPPMVEEASDIDLSDENLSVIVALVSGRIAGSIRLLRDGQSAEIKRLSVSDEWQNMGIGRRLMEEIEKHTEGISRLWLFTGGQSEKNIALYEKMGYRIYKEEPFKDEFTLVYMEKSI